MYLPGARRTRRTGLGWDWILPGPARPAAGAAPPRSRPSPPRYSCWGCTWWSRRTPVWRSSAAGPPSPGRVWDSAPLPLTTADSSKPDKLTTCPGRHLSGCPARDKLVTLSVCSQVLHLLLRFTLAQHTATGPLTVIYLMYFPPVTGARPTVACSSAGVGLQCCRLSALCTPQFTLRRLAPLQTEVRRQYCFTADKNRFKIKCKSFFCSALEKITFKIVHPFRHYQHLSLRLNKIREAGSTSTLID